MNNKLALFPCPLHFLLIWSFRFQKKKTRHICDTYLYASLAPGPRGTTSSVPSWPTLRAEAQLLCIHNDTRPSNDIAVSAAITRLVFFGGGGWSGSWCDVSLRYCYERIINVIVLLGLVFTKVESRRNERCVNKAVYSQCDYILEPHGYPWGYTFLNWLNLIDF